jgi:hypothetical protein
MQKRILKKALRLFVAENNNGKHKTCYAHSSGTVYGTMNNSLGINYLRSMPRGVGSHGDAKSYGGETKTP